MFFLFYEIAGIKTAGLREQDEKLNLSKNKKIYHDFYFYI